MTEKAPGRDRCLVLLAPYGAALWSHVMSALEDVAQILVVPPGDESDFKVMAEQIVRTLPARFRLVGFCSGGHLAVEIFRQVPERVEGIALLNTSLSPDTTTQRTIRRERIARLAVKALKMRTPDDAYLDHAAQWMVSPVTFRSSLVMTEVRRLLGEIPLSRSIAQQQAMLGRPDIAHCLSAVPVPVLAVGGEHDRVCPAASVETISRHAPKATVRMLEDCGHLSPIEKPVELMAILTKWLSHETANTLDPSLYLEQTE